MARSRDRRGRLQHELHRSIGFSRSYDTIQPKRPQSYVVAEEEKIHLTFPLAGLASDSVGFDGVRTSN